jgi:RNA polymerase sigma-70 factor, ECF subfamily
VCAILCRRRIGHPPTIDWLGGGLSAPVIESNEAGPSHEGMDLALLRKLQAGDELAWAQLTHEYSPRLYAYLRHNLPSAADAEDALGETLLAAVRALPNFDGRVSLSAFLYSLAYRKMADFWRRRHATAPLLESVVASDSLGASGDNIAFEELFDMLPEISRQVLLLRYHVGLSVSEIAEVIERSYKGTESLLSRARSQLRAALDRVDQEHG